MHQLELATTTSNWRTAGADNRDRGGWQKRSWIGSVTLVFVLALALRLWFNFGLPHINAFSCCDASEYLRNAGALVSLPGKLSADPAAALPVLMEYAKGQGSAASMARTRQALSSLKEVYQSGPIFPLFLAACYQATGKNVEPDNWSVPLFWQSVISAFTCVFISCIARAGWGFAPGVAAGVLAAFYPAFIVNSGRLYSETLAAFLLAFVAYICCKALSSAAGLKPPAIWAVAGLLAASLQLTRSIMFIVTIALLPVCLWRQRSRRWLSATLLAIGVLVVLLPWNALQQVAFGKGGLIVNRVGHYNLFIGNDWPGMGFLSYPYPDGHGIEQKSFLKLIGESYKHSPSRWAKLMLDKPVRLFKSPWNDFRASIGVVTYEHQVLFHQALLLLAAIGFGFATFGIEHGAALGASSAGTGASSASRTQPGIGSMPVRLYVYGIIALHLIYLLFITVPRYNLTAMPFLIMLSAAGAVALWNLLFNNSKPSVIVETSKLAIELDLPALNCAVALCTFFFVARLNPQTFAQIQQPESAYLLMSLKTAALVWLVLASLPMVSRLKHAKLQSVVLVTVTALVALPFVCLPLRAHGRPGELCTSLLPGETSEMQFEPAGGTDGRLQFLAFDTDSLSNLQSARITVNGKEVSNFPVPGMALIQEGAEVKVKSSDGTSYVECEEIFDSLSKPSGKSNGDVRQWFFVPLLFEWDKQTAQAGRVGGSSLDVRITNEGSEPLAMYSSSCNARRRTIPSLGRYSWEKAFYGVENDRDLTDSRYDDAIQSGHTRGQKLNILLIETETASDRADASQVAASAPAASAPAASAPVEARLGENQNVTIDAPHLVQEPAVLYVARISGTLSSKITREAQRAIRPVITFHGGGPQGEPRTYTTPWSPANFQHVDFDFCCPILASVFPDGPSTMDFSWTRLNLTGAQSLTPPQLSFKNLKVEIVGVARNPLQDGRRIAQK